MRDYEVTYVLSPNLEEETIAGFIEKFSDIVKSTGSEVAGIDNLGKKKLAYEIKNHKEGYYIVMKFKGVGETVSELGRILKIQDEVLRHIIVKLNTRKTSKHKKEKLVV